MYGLLLRLTPGTTGLCLLPGKFTNKQLWFSSHFSGCPMQPSHLCVVNNNQPYFNPISEKPQARTRSLTTIATPARLPTLRKPCSDLHWETSDWPWRFFHFFPPSEAGRSRTKCGLSSPCCSGLIIRVNPNGSAAPEEGTNKRSGKGDTEMVKTT